VTHTEADLRRRLALAGATRFLQRDEPQTPAETLRRLADLARDPLPDVYGEYGEIEALESEVAALLGKDAAVFMPTGTMAQQCALRIWVDRTGHRVVGVHGICHLVVHEERALEAIHGVRMEHLRTTPQPLTAADLTDFPHPLGALAVELPLRDAGYLLPAWEELVSLVEIARARGIPVHLDGARLWESQPFYDRPLAEIAALADSVYVSFYKGLGGIAGAALAGSADFIAEARHWQHRHGGTLVSAYPLAIAAREGVRSRVGRFADYAAQARRIAADLARLPGVRVFPEPPHTNAFVLFADVAADDLREAALRLAEETGLWALGPVAPAEVPGWAATEFVVGEATSQWTTDEVVAVVGRLIDEARKTAPTRPATP
jgi:threonine aldolase